MPRHPTPSPLNHHQTQLAQVPSLKQMVPSIRPSHVSSLFSLDLDPKTALNFSHGISHNPRFKHSVYSYASILIGMVDEMGKLYTEMLEEGEISPNVYTYNKMVFGYCKVGNVVMAKGYVCKIVGAGLEPDFFTDTSLIMGYCRSKDLDSAFKVFEEMALKGFKRNEVAYTHLIHGLCVARRVDEAMELFAKMKNDDNCYPTVRTYTVLINALCGSKRKSEALVLLKEKSERGITPNIHIERKFEEARELLGDMVEKGLVSSVVTYNALINGYCERGMMEDALDVVELMKSRNVSPNTRTYNELIHGFCKKNVHKAMGVFHKMLECRVAPSVVTYNSLIDGQCRSDSLCKRKRVEEARKLFDSLEEKGVDANVVMYTTLIDGYCNSDKLEEAKLILETMLSKSCLPNTSTFNALIHCLCTDGKLSEAMLLEKKMVEKGDFDHAERRAGRMKEAEGMMEKMKEDGVLSDSITYSSLIKGYADQGLTDSAFGVLKCMLDAGCEPSHHMFLSLIKHLNDLCLTSNMIEFDIVVELLEKMAENGVTPNARSYEMLIKGICETGNLKVAEKLEMYKEAAKVVDDMICVGQLLQLESCKSLICGLYKNGENERGAWVFKSLLRCGLLIARKGLFARG
ncbi:hypothetical protein HID58_054793 [Brassica napus]|uniref:Pentatricopeptide repeat-containing protein n=1 Tax=Brassica napus TaxID=3708 RepID=A0ABQ8AIJ3_BRANA|nr:hypothetical protein HID58_054793 [Brassica napus]